MLAGWLKRLEPVHVATTAEEREGIYRFRYSVYVDELGYGVPGADHEAKRVHSPDDDADFITHLYTGTSDAMTGVLTMTCWGAGSEVPAYDFRLLSMDRFPGISQLNCCELGRFMIHPSARGKLILPSLAATAIDILLYEKQMDLV